MTNYYENRLHQINILIKAYTDEDEQAYTDEVQKLVNEKTEILKHIHYME